MQVINLEMTDFSRLTADGEVQMTHYGSKVKVVANFSGQSYSYGNQQIPPHSLIIVQDGKTTVYTPKVP